jgi:hypothetical protein
MFCAPGLIFGGTEAIGFRFHVLPARTRFRQYRRRQVPFSCLPLPESFSAVTSASGPVFMFTAPGHVFGSNDGVGSCFHVFRSQTYFRRYRGRRVLIFGGVGGVGSRFNVLRARYHFRRYRVRRVPFSCCARTHFRRYRWRQVLFTCFALCDSFSAVPRASGPVFMFCAPGLIFDGAKGVGSHFHFCAPELVFAGTVGVRSCFHVLRSVIRFRWCRVRLVPFS